MTAQAYIQSRLDGLSASQGLPKPANDDELAEAIFKIVMSKKYRKYSVPEELAGKFKEAIRYDIEKGQPINVTFVHGAYKLWRLDESPEPDWAELFSAIYYTNWLRGICEIYPPGVWFDYFVDDLIVPKLNNIPLEDVETYLECYRKLIVFLGPYQPDNFKMTVTGVGEQFASPAAFDKKLAEDIKKYAADFPSGFPEVTEVRSAMVELNAKPLAGVTDKPEWKAENVLMHDAYIKLTKAGTGYHYQPGKILAFNQPLPVAIGVGTTRGSIAKFWAGVGALKPKDGADFSQVILSPKQLQDAAFHWEDVHIEGLQGKNFSKVRVLKPKL